MIIHALSWQCRRKLRLQMVEMSKSIRETESTEDQWWPLRKISCVYRRNMIQIYIDNNMFHRHQNNYHDCHCAKNVSADPSVMLQRLIIIIYYIIIILIVSYTRRWHTYNYQTIQCQTIDVPGGVTSQPKKPMTGPRYVWRTWRHLYNQWWWCNINTQGFVHTHTSLLLLTIFLICLKWKMCIACHFVATFGC